MSKHRIVVKREDNNIIIEYMEDKDFNRDDDSILNILSFEPDDFWDAEKVVDAFLIDNKEFDRYGEENNIEFIIFKNIKD